MAYTSKYKGSQIDSLLAEVEGSHRSRLSALETNTKSQIDVINRQLDDIRQHSGQTIITGGGRLGWWQPQVNHTKIATFSRVNSVASGHSFQGATTYKNMLFAVQDKRLSRARLSVHAGRK